MALYFDTDYDILLKNADNIKDKWKKTLLEKSEPSIENVYKVHNIILNYCKEKKRKLYGGLALHMLLCDKDKTKGLYAKDQVPPPDIDIYTPEPIEDMFYVTNMLHKEGYKYVRGEEALHGETYKIFYYKVNICDFSYVPKNVYNRIPFIAIDGINCVHPNFMTIDYLRMLSNPISSYWRFFEEANLKAFKRLLNLQKEYPLPVIKDDLVSPKPNKNPKVYELIYNFLLNRKSTVIIGFYAYNYFAMTADKKTVDIPFYEFISINYKEDGKEIIELLQKEFSDKITFKEFYPFFQFTDYNIEIYMDNELVCHIYDHNKVCMPYQDQKAHKFIGSTVSKINGSIRLGTFTLVLLYTLISAQRARTLENNEQEKFYYHMASKLIQIKNDYFEKNNKNFLDNTIFQHFVIDCIGEELTTEKINRLKIEKRKKQGMPAILRYVPQDKFREGPNNKFIFLNTSGNEINNPNNLKIYKKKSDKKNDKEEEKEEVEVMDGGSLCQSAVLKNNLFEYTGNLRKGLSTENTNERRIIFCELDANKNVIPLGRGAFGEVFAGKMIVCNNFIVSENKIAIKILKQLNDIAKKELCNELEILHRLDHPNIIKYWGYWSNNDKNEYAVLMELLKGVPLDKYFKEINYDVNKNLIIMKQLLDGISYLHQNDVVHRDIKPENIYISSSLVKYIDFGFTCQINRCENIVGTPIYASPEMIQHVINKKNDTSYVINNMSYKINDLWALGLVLYELFTRKNFYMPDEMKNFETLMASLTPEKINVKINEMKTPDGLPIPSHISGIIRTLLVRPAA